MEGSLAKCIWERTKIKRWPNVDSVWYKVWGSDWRDAKAEAIAYKSERNPENKSFNPIFAIVSAEDFALFACSY